ncbi:MULTISPECIES: MSHA biogenesis protein MshK [Undibacterium]|nr:MULTISPECIES: MSHA biogenesis protein MshK [Undibacterium]
MMNRHISLSLFILGLVAPAVVPAQELRDPTRPPTLNLSGPDIDVAPQPVLQSVLIGPNRKFAIIDGKTVKLNGKFGDYVLIKLTETEAVLKRGRELQTLKLFPDIEKKSLRNPQNK